MADLVIEHEHAGDSGAWFITVDGKRAGEMVYEDVDPLTIKIVHTQVSPELRGTGAGEKLVRAGVAWAREHETKVIAQCPYARATIMKHPELQDVLAR